MTDSPIYERERDRLNARIHYLQNAGVLPDKRTLKALKQYRVEINKRDAITERGVRAFPHQTPKGLRYRAADELQLCHAFLDRRAVPKLKV